MLNQGPHETFRKKRTNAGVVPAFVLNPKNLIYSRGVAKLLHFNLAGGGGGMYRSVRCRQVVRPLRK